VGFPCSQSTVHQCFRASGHKYGLVYPGIGWIIWRNNKALPEELVFSVNYLGGEMPTFAINFSRPGNYVVAQYYNFLRLGFDGYKRIHQASQDVALYLTGEIAKLGPFDLLSDGSDIPVFAFKLKDKVIKSGNYTVFDVSDHLRQRGWQVPAYTFPKNCEHIAALRVVVKEGFSLDLANMLLGDLRRTIEWFEAHPKHEPTHSGSNFSH
jgi:glutamate decarboxylase